MIFTFLIIPPAYSRTAIFIPTSNQVATLANSESQARERLAGLSLVFLSRKPYAGVRHGSC